MSVRSSSLDVSQDILPLLLNEGQAQRIQNIRNSILNTSAITAAPSFLHHDDSFVSLYGKPVEKVPPVVPTRTLGDHRGAVQSLTENLNHIINNTTAISSDDTTWATVIKSLVEEVETIIRYVEDQKSEFNTSLASLRERLTASETARQSLQEELSTLKEQSHKALDTTAELETKASLASRVEYGLRAGIKSLEEEVAQWIAKTQEKEEQRVLLSSQLNQEVLKSTSLQRQLDEEKRIRGELQKQFHQLELHITTNLAEKDQIAAQLDVEKCARAEAEARLAAAAHADEIMAAEMKAYKARCLAMEATLQRLAGAHHAGEDARAPAADQSLADDSKTKPVAEEAGLHGAPGLKEQIAMLTSSLQVIQEEMRAKSTLPKKLVHIHFPPAHRRSRRLKPNRVQDVVAPTVATKGKAAPAIVPPDSIRYPAPLEAGPSAVDSRAPTPVSKLRQHWSVEPDEHKPKADAALLQGASMRTQSVAPAAFEEIKSTSWHGSAHPTPELPQRRVGVVPSSPGKAETEVFNTLSSLRALLET